MYGMNAGSQRPTAHSPLPSFTPVMYAMSGAPPVHGVYQAAPTHGYAPAGVRAASMPAAAAGSYTVNAGAPDSSGGNPASMGDGRGNGGYYHAAGAGVVDYGYNRQDAGGRGTGVFTANYAVGGAGGGGQARYGRGGGAGGRGGGRGRSRGDGGMGSNISDVAPPSEDYEVHDNQLKAPVTVRPMDVIPTTGSARLFGGPPQPVVFGSRNVFRICEAFQEGRCAAGEKCYDIHLLPEYLHATRQQMTAWLQSREDDFNRTLCTDPTHSFRIFVTDLKEIVDVPVTALTFTKGLYVDPTTRARRTRAAHAQGGGGGGCQNAVAAQVPTGCGLYASDPSQCKWGRWCNQVHINPAWMQEKKEGFQSWFEKLELDFQTYPADHLFTVHDPHLKTGLQLPKFSVASFTRGLFQGSSKKAPSVCLLFQKGRCTAGACCNQIHIVPEYLNLVRAKATEAGGDPLGHQPSSSTQISRDLEALSAALLAQHVQQQQQQQQQPQPQQQPQQQQQHQQHQPEPQRQHSQHEYELPMAAPAPQPTHLPQHSPLGERSAVNSGRVSGPAPSWDPGADAYPDDCSGALFEHIPVDDDPMDNSSPPLLPLAPSGGANSSSLAVSVTHLPGHGNVTRHVNPNGSYTNKPYGSITSLREASASYHSRAEVASLPRTMRIGGSPIAAPSCSLRVQPLPEVDPSVAVFSRTPASSLTRLRATVHLPDYSAPAVLGGTGNSAGGARSGRGGGATPPITSPDSAAMLNLVAAAHQRSGSTFSASASGTDALAGANTGGVMGDRHPRHRVPGAEGSNGVGPYGYPSGRGPVSVARPPNVGAGYSGRTPGPQQAYGGGGHPLNRSHTGPEHLFSPQDFDRSLHFSPTPLLNLSMSNTSGTHYPRDEYNLSGAYSALRMGGGSSSGTTGYPQQSHSSLHQLPSHPQYNSPPQQPQGPASSLSYYAGSASGVAMGRNGGSAYPESSSRGRSGRGGNPGVSVTSRRSDSYASCHANSPPAAAPSSVSGYNGNGAAPSTADERSVNIPGSVRATASASTASSLNDPNTLNPRPGASVGGSSVGEKSVKHDRSRGSYMPEQQQS